MSEIPLYLAACHTPLLGHPGRVQGRRLDVDAASVSNVGRYSARAEERRVCSGSEQGSYLRLAEFLITQLQA